MPTLAELVNAIPVVNRGDVITPETHNSIRAALVNLASQLGQLNASSAGTPGKLSLAASLVQNSSTDSSWILSDGIASVSAANAFEFVNGILPVQLPDAARLTELVVRGRRAGSVTTFAVKLLRIGVSDGESTAVATANLRNASDPFAISQRIDPSLAVVDNDSFSYAIVAQARGVQDAVQLFSFSIAYTRG